MGLQIYDFILCGPTSQPSASRKYNAGLLKWLGSLGISLRSPEQFLAGLTIPEFNDGVLLIYIVKV
jgi:hypothetical protein